MDPSRGDLDCDSSRAGLMRLQGAEGQRGRGGGGDRLSSARTIKWWDWRGGLRGTACNWAFFLFVLNQTRTLSYFVRQKSQREKKGARIARAKRSESLPTNWAPRRGWQAPPSVTQRQPACTVCRCDWEPKNEILLRDPSTDQFGI